MNTNDNTYCQLKYACSLMFPENISLVKPKEKCFVEDFNKEFYVEEYYNFATLKERLDCIYIDVIQGYKNRGVDIFSDECSFPEFIICNRYGEYYPVGISAYGWKISIFIFDYLNIDEGNFTKTADSIFEIIEEEVGFTYEIQQYRRTRNQ